MSRASRTLVALAAAVIVLVIAVWFDNAILSDAEQQTRSDPSWVDTLTVLTVLGSLLVLAWKSASVVVGLAYVVVGGFFAALPWLWWNVARMTVDVLPEALAVAIRELGYSTQGTLNAVGTIGAAMLIAGIAALARWWRGRTVAAGGAEVMDPTADRMLP